MVAAATTRPSSTVLGRSPAASSFRATLSFSLFALLLLAACGGEPPPPPTATLSAEAAAGTAVFRRECAACHALAPDTVIVGPSLAHIATIAAGRVPGQTAEAYLLESIVRPDAYLVDGYENLMPGNFGRRLTGEELDALVALLLTLE